MASVREPAPFAGRRPYAQSEQCCTTSEAQDRNCGVAVAQALDPRVDFLAAGAFEDQLTVLIPDDHVRVFFLHDVAAAFPVTRLLLRAPGKPPIAT